jgi:uncharacterized protein
MSKEVFEKWKEAAIHNPTDTEKLFMLGFFYRNGIGVEQDNAQAEKWLLDAASLGHKGAKDELITLGLTFSMNNNLNEAERIFRLVLGLGYERAKDSLVSLSVKYYGMGQLEEAERLCVPLAESGHKGAIHSLFSLGNHYFNHDNANEAERLWELAARQGHEEAINSVADLGDYYTRKGNTPEVERILAVAAGYRHKGAEAWLMKRGMQYFNDSNHKKAEEIFTTLAVKGNTDARSNLRALASYYEVGKGVQKDAVEARRLYKLAANLGDAKAKESLLALDEEARLQFHNGDVYEAANKLKEAYECLKWAAGQENAHAIYAIGVWHAMGNELVPQSHKKAAEWWKMGADLGDELSQVNLGIYHYEGRGVSRNPAEAVRLWDLAAKQGNSDAQYYLANANAAGETVVKDPAEALRLWGLAAKNGNVRAQHKLGICYETGDGVEKNPAKAFRLYTLSATREQKRPGYAPAQYQLGICYATGICVAKDPEKAAQWFKLSAYQGYAPALYHMGVCHYHGFGVKKAPVVAKIYHNRADTVGQEWAHADMGKEKYNQYGTQVVSDNRDAAKLYKLIVGQKFPQTIKVLNADRGVAVGEEEKAAVKLAALDKRERNPAKAASSPNAERKAAEDEEEAKVASPARVSHAARVERSKVGSSYLAFPMKAQKEHIGTNVSGNSIQVNFISEKGRNCVVVRNKALLKELKRGGVIVEENSSNGNYSLKLTLKEDTSEESRDTFNKIVHNLTHNVRKSSRQQEVGIG